MTPQRNAHRQPAASAAIAGLMAPQRSSKLWLLAAFVALFTVLAVGSYSPPVAKAAVSLANVPSSIDAGSSDSFDLNADSGTGNLEITISGDGATHFILYLADCNGCVEEGDLDEADGSVSLIIDTDDGGFASQTLGFLLFVDCSSDDLDITIEVDEGNNGSIDDSDTFDCDATGGGGVVGSGGQVIAEADPNLLPCKGGTATINASAIDVLGDPIVGLGFHFETTAGLLTKIDKDTAEIKLGPGQTSAVVTVSVFDPPGDPDENGEIKSDSVTVSLDCNNFVSVVVTANPNVLQCGGVSQITATARDTNGHVIEGVGFHFGTDVGMLVTAPNNAKSDKGVATLSLVPGMPSSTVRASVGTTIGTVESTVTVQNFCPGVQPGQDSSMAPGMIALNSSSNTLGCGETIFIGVKVVDSKNQLVPDGTEVKFLASSGTMIPASAGTKNGALNVGYRAATDASGATPISGPVTVTAAAGDRFGKLSLQVNCGAAAPAATAGSAASRAPAPCVPIGDGVCISPPSTGDGVRISPPSTGDGGLKD